MISHLSNKFLDADLSSVHELYYEYVFSTVYHLLYPYTCKRQVHTEKREGKILFMSWKKWQNYEIFCFHKNEICVLKIDDGEGTTVSNPSGLDSRWYVYAVQFCSWICCHKFVHERDHPCMPTNIHKNYEKNKREKIC